MNVSKLVSQGYSRPQAVMALECAGGNIQLAKEELIAAGIQRNPIYDPETRINNKFLQEKKKEEEDSKIFNKKLGKNQNFIPQLPNLLALRQQLISQAPQVAEFIQKEQQKAIRPLNSKIPLSPADETAVRTVKKLYL
jgi:hypothetical protein